MPTLPRTEVANTRWLDEFWSSDGEDGRAYIPLQNGAFGELDAFTMRQHRTGWPRNIHFFQLMDANTARASIAARITTIDDAASSYRRHMGYNWFLRLRVGAPVRIMEWDAYGPLPSRRNEYLRPWRATYYALKSKAKPADALACLEAEAAYWRARYQEAFQAEPEHKPSSSPVAVQQPHGRTGNEGTI